jgi:hypothetical protein
LAVATLFAAIACACGGQAPPPDGTGTITFLTRTGCANTDRLRANLDSALKTLGRPVSYAMIDLDTLARTDVRSAYPTPTVLYQDHDVFGMAVPQPPYPEPT